MEPKWQQQNTTSVVKAPPSKTALNHQILSRHNSNIHTRFKRHRSQRNNSPHTTLHRHRKIITPRPLPTHPMLPRRNCNLRLKAILNNRDPNNIRLYRRVHQRVHPTHKHHLMARKRTLYIRNLNINPKPNKPHT